MGVLLALRQVPASSPTKKKMNGTGAVALDCCLGVLLGLRQVPASSPTKKKRKEKKKRKKKKKSKPRRELER